MDDGEIILENNNEDESTTISTIQQQRQQQEEEEVNEAIVREGNIQEDEGELRETQSKYRHLYIAAFTGDWETVIRTLSNDPKARAVGITGHGGTVLHAVVGFCQDTKILKKIINLLNQDELEVVDKLGHSALNYAIGAGNLKAVEILIDKNPRLLHFRYPKYRFGNSIVYAVAHDQKEAAAFLFSKTNINDISLDNYEAFSIVYSLIKVDLIAPALHALQQRNSLALCEVDGETLLSCLAGRPRSFPTGTRLGLWERFIYRLSSVNVQETGFDIESCTKDTTDGDVSLFRRNLLKAMVGKVRSIRQLKQIHIQALKLLNMLCEMLDAYEGISVRAKDNLKRHAVLAAAKCGNYEVITRILKSCPSAMNVGADREDGLTLFHVAAPLRHAKILSLVYHLGPYKDWLTGWVDKNDNCLLHYIAKLPAPDRLSGSGAVLQMQREIQWFKIVESWTRPSVRESVNIETPITKKSDDHNDQQQQQQQQQHSKADKRRSRVTARELFTKEHESLRKDAETWVMDTARSSTVVATLIASMDFAAAVSVPGGYNSDIKGIPTFLGRPVFMIFEISAATALFFSVTAILAFTVILTSSYKEDDFLMSLPLKIIFGISSLSFSAACMMVAFTSTLHILLSHHVKLIAIPISLLAVIPATYFLSMQLPLLLEMWSSTFSTSHLPSPDKADLRFPQPCPSQALFGKLKSRLSKICFFHTNNDDRDCLPQ